MINMNFLRQQADAFLTHGSAPLEEDEKGVADPLSPSPVEDPEMDEAIAEMKELLEDLRAKNALHRMKNRKQIQQLQAQHDKQSQRLQGKINAFIQVAHLTPYMEATKQVQNEIQTGIVATLQAQLCLHLHGICIHQEQTVLYKEECSQVLYWYEAMVKQLRQDQADQELYLMNELVQTKIHVGELVDAKKLRERQESQQPNNSVSSRNRRFSRSLSHGKTSNSSLQLARLRSKRNIRLQQVGEVAIQNTGSRQRIVRQISRRGMALQKTASIRNLNNNRMHNDSNHLTDSVEGTSDKTLGPSVSPVSVRKVHRMASASIPEPMRLKKKMQAKKRPSQVFPVEIIAEGEEEEEGLITTGLQPSSEDISARRTARAKARRMGRGVQRTRSKSLTDMARGSCRCLLSRSHEDTNVSRRRLSTKELLVGFPQQRRAQDDSGLRMGRRQSSTHQLLRGFSQTVAPTVMPVTPTSSQGSSVASSEEEEESSEGFAASFKNWMGTMQHKVAMIG